MRKIDLLNNITEYQLLDWCDKYSSATEILQKEFDMNVGGNRTAIIRNKMKEYGIEFLDPFRKSRKYDRLLKDCPVCNKKFEVASGSVNEKTTCSKGCAQTYFNSGENNSRFTGQNYRQVCFSRREHKCIICDENLVLEVHHIDNNRDNNHIDNLVPLCPTHHRYLHSKYYFLIEDKVAEYISKNINCV